MRSIWRGALAFGLVNVPVKLYSATTDHDLELHQVHDADGGRIRYQRTCEVCGQVVSYEHINKAYEEGGRTVILTDGDLASLPVERSREIEVVEFVPSESIDPIRFDRSYYLQPDSRSPKAYILLRQVLQHTERTALAHFSLRQKSRLAALRVHDEALVLQTLLWDDEVRDVHFPELDQDVPISDQELSMSEQLVESLSGDFTPSQFSDDYQEQLRMLVEAKLQSGNDVDTAATFGDAVPTPVGGEVLDLMEALRRSVAQARGDGSSSRSPAKKTAAKNEAAGEAKPRRRTPKAG